MRDRLYKLMDERHKTNVASMTINEPLPGIDPYEEPAVSDVRMHIIFHFNTYL